MNQIAAAILILASSVFGFGAVSTSQEATTLLGAASLAAGLCGVVALAAGLLPHHRDPSWLQGLDFGGSDNWSSAGRTRSIRDDGLTVQLPSDIKNQLNYLANLRGQDRDQLLHDLLRRDLASKVTRSA